MSMKSPESTARNALESHRESKGMPSSRVSNLTFVFWAVMAMVMMPYSGILEAEPHVEMENTTPPTQTIKASTGFNAAMASHLRTSR